MFCVCLSAHRLVCGKPVCFMKTNVHYLKFYRVSKSSVCLLVSLFVVFSLLFVSSFFSALHSFVIE